MKIILLHRHFDQDHLDNVTKEMQTLGAPTIKAVWSECYDAWVALEGCHRIRAAHALGLIPSIEEIEYSEGMTTSDVGVDVKEEMTIAEVVDDAWREEMVEFDD